MTEGNLLNSSPSLHIQYSCGVLIVVCSCLLFVYILTVVERSRDRLEEFVGDEGIDTVGHDTSLEVEHVDDDGNVIKINDYYKDGVKSNTNHESVVSKPPVRSLRAILPKQSIVIGLQVLVLTLLNYLLLVYLPGGSGWLSFLGITSVWVLTLQKVIIDEIRFHQRMDRLFALVTLFLLIACGLTLATYSRLALQEGHVYAGPARIVAYDASVYNNTDGQTLRANVRVAWGGSWGCSDSSRFCTADVNGSLCQTQYDVKAIQKQYEAEIEDYDAYVEQYSEQVETSFVDYDYSENGTEIVYGDGKEEVQVYAEGNGTEEVDIVYSDTNETLQLVKQQKHTSSCDNCTDQDGVKLHFEKDFNNTSASFNNSELGEASQSTIVGEIPPNNSTNQTAKHNKNHNRDLTIDSTLQAAEVEQEVDKEVDVKVEELAENEAEQEEQYYNGIVDEVSEVEKENADTVIEESLSLEQLQQEYDELAKENKDLQKEQDALKQKLSADSEEEEDLDSSLLSMEYTDDYMDGSYWTSYDWEGIWGMYSCEDMFNYDLSSSTFDPNEAPDLPSDQNKHSQHASDVWPTMNIYGSCKTCTAYIMDYYSNQHFRSILQFQRQAQTYFLWSIGTAIIACFLCLQHKRKPRNENKRELLATSDTGHKLPCHSNINFGRQDTNVCRKSTGDPGVLA